MHLLIVKAGLLEQNQHCTVYNHRGLGLDSFRLQKSTPIIIHLYHFLLVWN